MNGSRNESTARKMARGKTQTAAERRACMNFHRKFIWFGKIRGSSTVDFPRVPKRLPKMHLFVEKPSFMTVLGEPLGNLGESTARNRPCGKCPVGKQISLESGVDLYILDERGLDFDVLGEPRGASGSLGGPSTTTTTHLDITIPPPHHAQEKNTS